MTSCRAVMASVAMADTRAWSTVAELRSFWAKRSVALRPEPAAVGLGAVGALMVVLLRRCGWGVPARTGSAVLAVVRELVGVDVDADPGPRTDDELAAGDLQRFGEQVVAH